MAWIFIGNTDKGRPPYLDSLTTLRLSDDARDIHGKPLPGFQAMHIDASEEAAHDRIMMTRFRKARRTYTKEES